MDDIRTVVIRGEGGKAFSSGYDLSGLPKEVKALKEKNPLDIGFDAIEQYPYPVLAMIDGFALGAGCELGYDMRYKDRLGKIKNGDSALPPRGGLSSQGGTKIHKRHGHGQCHGGVLHGALL